MGAAPIPSADVANIQPILLDHDVSIADLALGN